MSVPVLLINGAWHGAWCWALLGEELAARGVGCLPVELEGFGGLHGVGPEARWTPGNREGLASERSPVAHVTVAGAAASLVERVRYVTDGRPCVLVAHSLGGVVVAAALEAAPRLFAHIVWVTAWAPTTGVPVVRYHERPEMADTLLVDLLVADPTTVGALRISTADAASRDRAARTFYHDVPVDMARAATTMLASDVPAAVAMTAPEVSRERFGRVRHSYVVCTRDRAVRPAAQRQVVAELGDMCELPVEVHEIEASHSPFLSRPGELADVLAGVHASAVSSRPWDRDVRPSAGDPDLARGSESRDDGEADRRR